MAKQISAPNGILQQLKIGQKQTIKISKGQHLRVQDLVNGVAKDAIDVIALRQGVQLKLKFADGTELEFDNFYQECAGQACSVTVAGKDSGGYVLNGEASAGVAVQDGGQLIYAYGEQTSLMSLAGTDSGLATTLGALGGGTVAYLPGAAVQPAWTSLLGVVGAVGAIGLAAAGGGGGGGGLPSENPDPVDPIPMPKPEPRPSLLEGSFVAGPVLDVNGLVATAYDAKGTVLQKGVLSKDGSFTLDLGGYTGAVLVTVSDTTLGSDYWDEATGAPKNLGSMVLRAATHSTGGTVHVNVNAFTEVAVRQLGVSGTVMGDIVTTAQIDQANKKVADALGLKDLVAGEAPVAVVTNSGAANTAANAYGKLLAAASGVDEAGSTEATIQALLGTMAADNPVLATSVLLLEGAKNVLDKVPGFLTEGQMSLNDYFFIADTVNRLRDELAGSIEVGDYRTIKALSDAIKALEATAGGALADLKAKIDAIVDTNITYLQSQIGDLQSQITTNDGDIAALINNGTGTVGDKGYVAPSMDSLAGLKAAIEALQGATTGAGGTSETLNGLQTQIDDILAKLDITAPTLTGITLSATGADALGHLNAGDVVTATVKFSEAVLVTDAQALKLQLMIGTQAVLANYQSGAGSDSLVFSYTILASQTDANGIAVPADALQLDTASIKDAMGNAAVVTSTALADNASFIVDTGPLALNLSAAELFASDFDTSGKLAQDLLIGHNLADVSLTITSALSLAQAAALQAAGFDMANKVTYELRDYDTALQAAMLNPVTAAVVRGATLVTAVGDELANAMRFTSFDNSVNLRIEAGAGNDTIDSGRSNEQIVGGSGADTINLTYKDTSADTVIYQTIYDGQALPVTTVAFSSDAADYRVGSVLSVSVKTTTYSIVNGKETAVTNTHVDSYTVQASDTPATALEGLAAQIRNDAGVQDVVVRGNVLEIVGTANTLVNGGASYEKLTKLSVAAPDAIVNEGQKTQWTAAFSTTAADYPSSTSAGGKIGYFDRFVHVTIDGVTINAEIVYDAAGVAKPAETLTALKSAVEAAMGAGQPLADVLGAVSADTIAGKLVLTGKTAPVTDGSATFSVTSASIDKAGVQQQTQVTFSKDNADYYEGGKLSVDIAGVTIEADMVAGNALASVRSLMDAVNAQASLSQAGIVETVIVGEQQVGTPVVLDVQFVSCEASGGITTVRDLNEVSFNQNLSNYGKFTVPKVGVNGYVIVHPALDPSNYAYTTDVVIVDAVYTSMAEWTAAVSAIFSQMTGKTITVSYNSANGNISFAGFGSATRFDGASFEFAQTVPYLKVTANTEATDPLGVTGKLSFAGEAQTATISLEDAATYSGYASDVLGITAPRETAGVYFQGGKLQATIEVAPDTKVTVQADMVAVAAKEVAITGYQQSLAQQAVWKNLSSDHVFADAGDINLMLRSSTSTTQNFAFTHVTNITWDSVNQKWIADGNQVYIDKTVTGVVSSFGGAELRFNGTVGNGGSYEAYPAGNDRVGFTNVSDTNAITGIYINSLNHFNGAWSNGLVDGMIIRDDAGGRYRLLTNGPTGITAGENITSSWQGVVGQPSGSFTLELAGVLETFASLPNETMAEFLDRVVLASPLVKDYYFNEGTGSGGKIVLIFEDGVTAPAEVRFSLDNIHPTTGAYIPTTNSNLAGLSARALAEAISAAAKDPANSLAGVLDSASYDAASGKIILTAAETGKSTFRIDDVRVDYQGVRQIASIELEDAATYSDAGRAPSVYFSGGRAYVTVTPIGADGQPGAAVTVEAEMTDGNDVDALPDAAGTAAALVAALNTAAASSGSLAGVIAGARYDEASGKIILTGASAGQQTFRVEDVRLDYQGVNQIATVDFSELLAGRPIGYFSGGNLSLTIQGPAGDPVTISAAMADGTDTDDLPDVAGSLAALVAAIQTEIAAGGRLDGVVGAVSETNGVITLTSAGKQDQQFTVMAATATDDGKREVTSVSFSINAAGYFAQASDAARTQTTVSVSVLNKTYTANVVEGDPLATVNALLAELNDPVAGIDTTKVTVHLDVGTAPTGDPVLVEAAFPAYEAGHKLTVQYDLNTIDVYLASHGGFSMPIDLKVQGAPAASFTGAQRYTSLADWAADVKAYFEARLPVLVSYDEKTGILEIDSPVVAWEAYSQPQPTFQAMGTSSIQLIFSAQEVNTPLLISGTKPVDAVQQVTKIGFAAELADTDFIAAVGRTVSVQIAGETFTLNGNSRLELLQDLHSQLLDAIDPADGDSRAAIMAVLDASGVTLDSANLTLQLTALHGGADPLNVSSLTRADIDLAGANTYQTLELGFTRTYLNSLQAGQLVRLKLGTTEASYTVKAGDTHDAILQGLAAALEVAPGHVATAVADGATRTITVTADAFGPNVLGDPLLSTGNAISLYTNDVQSAGLSADQLTAGTIAFSADHSAVATPANVVQGADLVAGKEMIANAATGPSDILTTTAPKSSTEENVAYKNVADEASYAGREALSGENGIAQTHTNPGGSYTAVAGKTESGTTGGGDTAYYGDAALSGDAGVKQTYANPADGYTGKDNLPLNTGTVTAGSGSLYGSDSGYYADDGLHSTYLNGGTSAAVDGQGNTIYTKDRVNEVLTDEVDLSSLKTGSAASTYDLAAGNIVQVGAGLAGFTWDGAETTVITSGSAGADVIHNFQTDHDFISLEEGLLVSTVVGSVDHVAGSTTMQQVTLKTGDVTWSGSGDEYNQALPVRWSIDLGVSSASEAFTIDFGDTPFLHIVGEPASGSGFTRLYADLDGEPMHFDNVGAFQAYVEGKFVDDLAVRNVGASTLTAAQAITWSFDKGVLTADVSAASLQYDTSGRGDAYSHPYRIIGENAVGVGFDLNTQEFGLVDSTSSTLSAMDLGDASKVATLLNSLFTFNASGSDDVLNASVFAVTAADDPNATALWAHRQSSANDGTVEAAELYQLALLDTIGTEFQLQNFHGVMPV